MKIPYRPQAQLSNKGAGVKVNPTLMANAANAAAPIWKGMGDMAQVFGEQAERLQNYHDDELSMKAQMEGSQILSDFQNAERTNQDPSTIVKNFDEQVAPKLMGLADNPDYTPRLKEHLRKKFTGLVAHNRIESAKRASLMQIANTKGAHRNLINSYVDQGNFSGAVNSANEMHSKGLLADHEHESLVYDLNKGEQKFNLDGLQQTNPDEALKQLDKRGAFGLSEGDRNREIERTKNIIDNKNHDMMVSISDQMELGKITNEEELDDFAPDLKPLQRLRAIKLMAKANEAKVNDFVKTKEYQRGLVGGVSEALYNIPDNIDKKDDLYWELESQIRLISDPSKKKRYSEMLSEAVGITERKRKSKLTVAEDIINKGFEHNLSNLGKRPEKVRKSIAARDYFRDSNFFGNYETLASFGATDEQITMIQDATEKVNGEDVSTLEAKAKTFKALYDQFPGKKQPEGFNNKLVNVLLHKGLDHEAHGEDVTDLKAQAEWDLKHRKMMMDKGEYIEALNDWARNNPDASQELYAAQAMTYSREIEARQNDSFMSLKDEANEANATLKKMVIPRARIEKMPEQPKPTPKIQTSATSSSVKAEKQSMVGGEVESPNVYKKESMKTTNSSAPKGATGNFDANAKDAIQMIKGFEGYNPKRYDDFKQDSIGYGTYAKPGETYISEAEASKRLAEEIIPKRKHVLKTIKKYEGMLKHKFLPHQIDALTSFAYNLGEGCIDTLFAKGTRSPAQIANAMLLYNRAGGKPLRGLTKRRGVERALFLNGYTK